MLMSLHDRRQRLRWKDVTPVRIPLKLPPTSESIRAADVYAALVVVLVSVLIGFVTLSLLVRGGR